jgi:hypothetical protein
MEFRVGSKEQGQVAMEKKRITTPWPVTAERRTVLFNYDSMPLPLPLSRCISREYTGWAQFHGKQAHHTLIQAQYSLAGTKYPGCHFMVCNMESFAIYSNSTCNISGLLHLLGSMYPLGYIGL